MDKIVKREWYEAVRCGAYGGKLVGDSFNGEYATKRDAIKAVNQCRELNTDGTADKMAYNLMLCCLTRMIDSDGNVISEHITRVRVSVI